MNPIERRCSALTAPTRCFAPESLVGSLPGSRTRCTLNLPAGCLQRPDNSLLDEQHLASVLKEFVSYYNQDRPHRTLGLQTPESRPRLPTGPIRSRPVLNGLHHVYERAA